MTPDPLTLKAAQAPAPAAPATAPAAAPAVKPKSKFDQRWIGPILITSILAVAQMSLGVLEGLEKTLLAILTSVICEVVLGKLYYGQVPHLASAYISGISVGILVRSPWFWPYALCAAITIFSKYVIRVKGRHIWNPSNFGIAWMLFTAPATVASLSIQWGNSLGAMVVIWILGSVIIGRLKRFHICATYVLSFLFFAAVRSAFTGHTFAAEVAPLTGPMYQLFTFFMITDPKTTVHSKKGQMVVVFLVALVEAVLRLFQNVHAPYYALFIVGPIANLVEMWWQQRHPKPAAAPQPAAA